MNIHNSILRFKVSIFLFNEKLSNFLFGKIEDCDVSKVTEINNLFKGKGYEGDLSKWNIVNLKYINQWP